MGPNEKIESISISHVAKGGKEGATRLELTETVWRIRKARTNSSSRSCSSGRSLHLLRERAVLGLHHGDLDLEGELESLICFPLTNFKLSRVECNKFRLLLQKTARRVELNTVRETIRSRCDVVELSPEAG